MADSKFYLKLGFTDDSSLWVSKMIRKVTKGPSHALVLVLEVTPTGEQKLSYHESIAKTDAKTHKTGVRGPISFDHLASWLAGKENRTLLTVPEDGWLPLTQHEAKDAIQKMKDAVNIIYYAPLQLAMNLLAAKLNTRLTFGDGSPLAWTCVEMPLRCHVLPPRVWDLLNMLTLSADEFWPGGPSQYSLYAAAQRVVNKYGTIQP